LECGIHNGPDPERLRAAKPRRTYGRLAEIAMSDGPVNVRDLAVGTRIVLVNGAEAEIVSNPNDGVWIFARYLTAPGDPVLVGQEEMIFAQDVAELRR